VLTTPHLYGEHELEATNVDEPDLAARLLAARRTRGLTQAQAAVEVGTSPQTWARWEAGHRPQMRFHGSLERFLEQRSTLRLIRDDREAAPQHDLSPLQVQAIESYLARAATSSLSLDEIKGYRAIFAKLGIPWDS
jgi:transcriptional regulator with XRE-family HTH domain